MAKKTKDGFIKKLFTGKINNQAARDKVQKKRYESGSKSSYTPPKKKVTTPLKGGTDTKLPTRTGILAGGDDLYKNIKAKGKVVKTNTNSTIPRNNTTTSAPGKTNIGSNTTKKATPKLGSKLAAAGSGANIKVPNLVGNSKAAPKYKQTRKQKRQAAKSASLTARADSSEKTGLYTRKKVDRLRNRAKRKDERSKGTRKSAVGTALKAVGKGAQAFGHAYAYGNTDRLKGNKVSSNRKGVARAAADKEKEGERKKAGFNKYTRPGASKFKPIKSTPIVSKNTPSLGTTGSKKKKNRFTSKK